MMGSRLPDIFLSYGHDDVQTAKRFAESFEREGISVWWDASIRSGEAFDAVIENALKGAKAVVVLWSKTSVQSRWVRAEATLADRNRTLVPAMIEACERPIMLSSCRRQIWRTGAARRPTGRGRRSSPMCAAS